MSTISTHILDTSLGSPAAGVAVTLEQSVNDSWHPLSSHVTDEDGRIKQLANPTLSAGIYRISFATEAYFKAKSLIGLYPLVQITILIRDQTTHYHIPLLLTANGYSTYRGS